MKKNITFRIMLIFAIILLSVLMLFIAPYRTKASADNTSVCRNKYYTSIYVNCGDTLWSIADKYITDEYSDNFQYINEIMSINNMQDSNIKSGMKLCIPYYADQPARI